MRLGKLMITITEFVCVGEGMRDALSLPLDSNYHMYCSSKGKERQVCKIGVHYDLQIFLYCY